MLNIAIDGHVASGKSVVAKAIAKRLNIKVLDTGAIYRGLACEFKEKGLSEPNEKVVSEFIKDVDVAVEFIDEQQHVIVNKTDYTPYLRSEEISTLSSKISPYPALRGKVLEIQRAFAKENDCVMEGRDIGTDVLPNADIKLFITANAEVRARRRYEQVGDGSVTFEKVLADLIERDYKDEHRSVAPLKPAQDSIILDTSNMTLEEVIEKCISIIKDKTKF